MASVGDVGSVQFSGSRTQGPGTAGKPEKLSIQFSRAKAEYQDRLRTTTMSDRQKGMLATTYMNTLKEFLKDALKNKTALSKVFGRDMLIKDIRAELLAVTKTLFKLGPKFYISEAGHTYVEAVADLIRTFNSVASRSSSGGDERLGCNREMEAIQDDFTRLVGAFDAKGVGSLYNDLTCDVFEEHRPESAIEQPNFRLMRLLVLKMVSGKVTVPTDRKKIAQLVLSESKMLGEGGEGEYKTLTKIRRTGPAVLLLADIALDLKDQMSREELTFMSGFVKSESKELNAARLKTAVVGVVALKKDISPFRVSDKKLLKSFGLRSNLVSQNGRRSLRAYHDALLESEKPTYESGVPGDVSTDDESWLLEDASET